MNELFTRRKIVIGAGGAVVLAAATFEGTRLLRKHHAPTAFDDLLSQLDDRDAGAQIGEAALANSEDFDANAVATNLRARLKRDTLAQALSGDLSEGHLLEARGWVLPEMLGQLCELAAKATA